MCCIVGAVSVRNIVPVLVQGLERLEYRGYDSCGVAVYAHGDAAAHGMAHEDRPRDTVRLNGLKHVSRQCGRGEVTHLSEWALAMTAQIERDTRVVVDHKSC
jgi:glutamine phosphoribosylpyrophosphate amidotransferase